MSYDRYGWDGGYRDDSPEPREDQPGDTPPACADCRKRDHCPTFLPAVEAYRENIPAWRDRDGDPTPCVMSDDSRLSQRIALAQLQARHGTGERKAAALLALPKLRRLLSVLRVAGRRTSKGKGRDARGRWVPK